VDRRTERRVERCLLHDHAAGLRLVCAKTKRVAVFGSGGGVCLRIDVEADARHRSTDIALVRLLAVAKKRAPRATHFGKATAVWAVDRVFDYHVGGSAPHD